MGYWKNLNRIRMADNQEWFDRLLPGQEKIVLAPKEVATLLEIPEDKVYESLAEGEIPSIKWGTRWLIPRAALDKMNLAAHRAF